MNPVAMALIIVTLNAVFAVSAWRRFNLLKVGQQTWESRLTEIPKRLGLVWVFAFYQKKMRYYLAAGLAHQFIFLGFVVLLLRTLVLWGEQDSALSARLLLTGLSQYVPDVHVERFANAGHWLHRDLPETVAQRLIAFFAS